MKAFFIFLAQNSVSIFDGIKTKKGHKGNYVQLAEIPGVPAEKFQMRLDFKNPASLDNKGVIKELFIKIYGAQRFRDAGFVSACAPTKKTSAIMIFTSKRWPELGLEIMEGKPNGEFPGVQIMNEGDTLRFTHENVGYQLTNSGGEPWLTKVLKPKMVPTTVKQSKTAKPVEVVDNRKKITEQPKVVGKIPVEKIEQKNSQIKKFEKKYAQKSPTAGNSNNKEVMKKKISHNKPTTFKAFSGLKELLADTGVTTTN